MFVLLKKPLKIGLATGKNISAMGKVLIFLTIYYGIRGGYIV